MVFKRESDDVYKALVADLAYSAVANSIMGVCLTVVGAFVHVLTGSVAALGFIGLGVTGTLAKLVLIVRHRRFNAQAYLSLSGTRGFELAHYVTTALIAASVAGICTTAHLLPDSTIDNVATALLFGYCAGVVCRLSVRPLMAAGAMSLAAFPPTIALFVYGDFSHRIVALMFCLFVTGAMETISHVYCNARKHIEAQIRMAALARLDHLTGLPNRLALEEILDDGRLLAGGGLVAVHVFDLDGFKAMNDRHGHAAGDQLLRVMANRLRTALSERDFAARIGGDEFVIVQPGIDSRDEADAFAASVHDLLTLPYPVGQATLRVGLSLGYAIAPAAEARLPALLEAADAASYRAKKRGGGLQATG